MKKHLPLLVWATMGMGLGSAVGQNSTPAGGGGYLPPTGICLTAEQRVEIDTMLARNVRQLISQGLLPAEPARPEAAVLLALPCARRAASNTTAFMGFPILLTTTR